MHPLQLIKQRLHLQLIDHQPFKNAGEVVHHMGAMQAQDYAGAKWSLALRLAKATEQEIEEAVSQKQVVRTWALRSTLHFVSPKDVRWMLTLLREKLIHNAALNNNRLGLDEKTLKKGIDTIAKSLEGGKILTRDELSEFLQRKKLAVSENRLSHFLGRAAIEQLICFGPRKGKEYTFTLLDEWVPATTSLSKQASLAELASRYLNSHGPATVKDFTWWSGLPPAAAREAFELVRNTFSRETIDGTEFWLPASPAAGHKISGATYLLPGFDEYMLGYTGRGLVAEEQHVKKLMGLGNAVFPATVVINGKVEGTWKRTLLKDRVLVEVTPFSTFSPARQTAVAKAAKHFGRYLSFPVETVIR